MTRLKHLRSTSDCADRGPNPVPIHTGQFPQQILVPGQQRLAITANPGRCRAIGLMHTPDQFDHCRLAYGKPGAASRAELPASTACSRRRRRSCDNGAAIPRCLVSGVESEPASPRPVHRSVPSCPLCGVTPRRIGTELDLYGSTMLVVTGTLDSRCLREVHAAAVWEGGGHVEPQLGNDVAQSTTARWSCWSERIGKPGSS